MSGIILPEKVSRHSKSVAELMYYYTGDMDMYILGMLHDIGKINGIQNHAYDGYKITKSVGFKYCREILHHGNPDCKYESRALDVLNAADLSVDSNGNKVGYVKRLEDIKSRYGENSIEYRNSKRIVNQLISQNINPVEELNLCMKH